MVGQIIAGKEKKRKVAGLSPPLNSVEGKTEEGERREEAEEQ